MSSELTVPSPTVLPSHCVGAPKMALEPCCSELSASNFHALQVDGRKGGGMARKSLRYTYGRGGGRLGRHLREGAGLRCALCMCTCMLLTNHPNSGSES